MDQMKLLKRGDKGQDVKNLQKLLGVTMDGDFGPLTESSVKRFQMNYNIMPDGIVCSDNLQMLIVHKGKVEEVDLDNNNNVIKTDYGQIIERYYLPKGEYVDRGNKPQLRHAFLHHTAGRENPYKVVDSWGRDDRGRVGTEYVLGGQSHTSGNTDNDGVMVKAFPDNGYAYHLGKTGSGAMNKASVGIEICSMGYLDSNYMTYVNSKCLASQVIKLAEPFKNKLYWHRYSDRQIEEIEKWIKYVGEKEQIDMRLGLKQWIKKFGPTKAFGFQEDAYYGKVQGLLTHTNVRKDKSDCYPDPRLVDVIMSIK